MAKLNQIVAIVKGTKQAVERAVTDIYHQIGHRALFDGLVRVYTPLDEQGDKLPTEVKKVQVKADDVLFSAISSWTELIDIVATQDVSNTKAVADVVVIGEKVLMKNVPATHLMFMEKKLIDIKKFIEDLPILDAAQDWTYDPKAGTYRTDVIQQIRTKKVQEPLVLSPATKEHPAQTQLVSKDVNVGTWNITQFSGALASDTKKALLQRVKMVAEAVKFAREQANSIEAIDTNYSDDMFGFIIGNAFDSK
ncbi:MAG: hypothetical protein ABID61_02550 [Candidatus Micrarchaeota archaeon]